MYGNTVSQFEGIENDLMITLTIALKGRQELGGFSTNVPRSILIGFSRLLPRTLAAPYA